MGWWKISGSSGHVKWSAGVNNDGARLFNSIPGRDDPAQMYNGDEPADILDAAIKNIETHLRDENYRTEAKCAFLQQSSELETIDNDAYMALQNANEKISNVYRREWQRPPWPAELSAVFEFCTSSIVADCNS